MFQLIQPVRLPLHFRFGSDYTNRPPASLAVATRLDIIPSGLQLRWNDMPTSAPHPLRLGASTPAISVKCLELLLQLWGGWAKCVFSFVRPQ